MRRAQRAHVLLQVDPKRRGQSPRVVIARRELTEFCRNELPRVFDICACQSSKCDIVVARGRPWPAMRQLGDSSRIHGFAVAAAEPDDPVSG